MQKQQMKINNKIAKTNNNNKKYKKTMNNYQITVKMENSNNINKKNKKKKLRKTKIKKKMQMICKFHMKICIQLLEQEKKTQKMLKDNIVMNKLNKILN